MSPSSLFFKLLYLVYHRCRRYNYSFLSLVIVTTSTFALELTIVKYDGRLLPVLLTLVVVCLGRYTHYSGTTLLVGDRDL